MDQPRNHANHLGAYAAEYGKFYIAASLGFYHISLHAQPPGLEFGAVANKSRCIAAKAAPEKHTLIAAGCIFVFINNSENHSSPQK